MRAVLLPYQSSSRSAQGSHRFRPALSSHSSPRRGRQRRAALLLRSGHRTSSEIHPARASELPIFEEFGCRLSILTARALCFGRGPLRQHRLPARSRSISRPRAAAGSPVGPFPRRATAPSLDSRILSTGRRDRFSPELAAAVRSCVAGGRRSFDYLRDALGAGVLD